jgi:sugar phosphate isomerase/epimerase
MKKLSFLALITIGSSLALTAAPAPVDFHEHLGLQMYSLRETLKTDELRALELVKSYGLTEIETGDPRNLPPAVYLKVLQVFGLTPVSVGFGYEQLGKDLPQAVQDAKTLGAKFVMVAWIPHDESGLTAREAHQAAADFNKWGEAFHAAGITFCYHPHGYEFIPFPAEQNQTAFDILMQETKSADVSLEMDVFWIYHAGQDPVKMLQQYPDRWVLMHLKDLRKGAPRGIVGGSRAPATDNVSVGTGEIDWKAVLSAARANGVQHYFLEDETPTPLTCIPESLAYLRALKL